MKENNIDKTIQQNSSDYIIPPNKEVKL